MPQATDNNIKSNLVDGVLWVRIERPDQHNALSMHMLDAIGSVFKAAVPNTQIRAAVITGAGTASFAAGGDLKELDAVRTVAATRAMSQTGMRALNTIRQFPAPVIAALNGSARGGGAELALACDLRVAAAHAKFGLIQGQLGLSTAWGGGTDLFALLGQARGLLTLGQARLLSAVEALDLGLVDHVLTANGAASEKEFSLAMADYLAPMLARPSQVLRAHKSLALERRAQLGIAAQQRAETEQLVATWTHDDHWQAAATALKPKPTSR